MCPSYVTAQRGQARGPPLKPLGPRVFAAAQPEPQLYNRLQLSVTDSHGQVDLAILVQRCPCALTAGDACSSCQIVRSGTITKHGVLSTGFPVAVSGVPRMRCRTHERYFHLLHPLVFEALPAGTLVQPDLVVLTEDVVLQKDAYLTLGTQVSTAFGDFAA